MVTRLAPVTIAGLALGLAATAQAAPPKAPRTASPGKSFTVPAPTRGKPARYFLSHDTKRSLDDVQLIGPAPARGAHVTKTASVSLPSVPAGAYRLLTCAGSHCAASPNVVTVAGGPQTQLQAFSDSTNTDDPYLASTKRFDPGLCPAPVPPGRLPSTAGALKSAEDLLAKAAGPAGMASFERSSAYGSTDAGESAAFEAVAVGKPGAALAALLRAHELKPDEPRYLVGAAAILTGLGYHKEALSLLNAAAALNPTRSAPFGINNQALALNAKGAALLALGQFADAEHFLRAAIEIEPLLAEAKQNLAVALMCGKKDDDALRFLRVGLVRQGTLNPDGSIALPGVEDLLDVTHGATATLPPFPVPESFEVAKKSEALYGAISRAAYQRLSDRGKQGGELLKQDFAHPDSIFTRQRQLEIVKFATDPPQFRAEKDAYLASMRDTNTAVLNISADLGAAGLVWQHDASAACSGIYDGAKWQACYDRHYQAACIGPSEAANNKVAELIAAEDKIDRDYIAHYYPFATAVLANISNPVVHDRWSIILDGSADIAWTAPLQAANYWATTTRLMYCGQPPATEPTAPTDGPVTPHSEACPAFVKGVKLSWKFAADKSHGVPFDLGIDVNCEKVSLEASGNVEGWFGVFGQLDWSPRSGKMTIFAGPKANAKIPGTTIGGSFKDGLYVTFKGDESVGDFGFRTSVSGSAGFGPFSIKGGDSMDFSFAPVFGLK